MKKGIRIEIVEPKKTIQTRTNLSALMGPRVAGSAICNRQPVVQTSCAELVAAGVVLADEDRKVGDLEAKLAAQRTKRDEAQVVYDRCFDLVVAGVEKYALTPTEVTELALALFQRQTYVLAPPLSIEATFDPSTRLIAVAVELPPGAQTCIVEVTTTPEDPDSWRRVKGHGSQRTLTGYKPGTYWFRALCSRGNDDSEPVEATSVVVK